jgi:hypothetical protein
MTYMEFLNKWGEKINGALPLGAKKEIAHKVNRSATVVSVILKNQIKERKHEISDDTIREVLRHAIDIINRNERIGQELEKEFDGVSSHS